MLSYVRYLQARGHVISRFRAHPPGEARAIVWDVYDETRNNLIEAKGSGARGEIRMASGQLLDYARYQTPPPTVGVLVPARARQRRGSLSPIA